MSAAPGASLRSHRREKQKPAWLRLSRLRVPHRACLHHPPQPQGLEIRDGGDAGVRSSASSSIAPLSLLPQEALPADHFLQRKSPLSWKCKSGSEGPALLRAIVWCFLLGTWPRTPGPFTAWLPSAGSPSGCQPESSLRARVYTTQT